jgi:hypothetical protein
LTCVYEVEIPPVNLVQAVQDVVNEDRPVVKLVRFLRHYLSPTF